jgi:hypothetical protein
MRKHVWWVACPSIQLDLRAQPVDGGLWAVASMFFFRSVGRTKGTCHKGRGKNKCAFRPLLRWTGHHRTSRRSIGSTIHTFLFEKRKWLAANPEPPKLSRESAMFLQPWFTSTSYRHRISHNRIVLRHCRTRRLPVTGHQVCENGLSGVLLSYLHYVLNRVGTAPTMACKIASYLTRQRISPAELTFNTIVVILLIVVEASPTAAPPAMVRATMRWRASLPPRCQVLATEFLSLLMVDQLHIELRNRDRLDMCRDRRDDRVKIIVKSGEYIPHQIFIVQLPSCYCDVICKSLHFPNVLGN